MVWSNSKRSTFWDNVIDLFNNTSQDKFPLSIYKQYRHTKQISCSRHFVIFLSSVMQQVHHMSQRPTLLAI
jgi:hypothetical protein